MDPSTVPASSTTDAQPMASRMQQQPVLAGQPGSLSQPSTAPVVPSVPTKQPISVHPEQGAVQTEASQSEDQTIKPIAQPASEIQEIEVNPSIPELKVEKSIEHVVEKSPDADKPKLPDEVKAVGVTHSGPGVVIDDNVFHIKKMPETYEEAANDVKQHPKLNDSKHWLGELIMYVWRKLDPTYGKTKGVK